MVDYNPASAAAAQVFPFEDLPSEDTPVTAAWLNHVHGVLADVAGDGARLETAETTLASKQAGDADLTAIAGLSPSNDDVIQRKAGAWANRTMAQVKTDLSLTKSDVGLGSVDNTADTAKPVSTAQQTALDAKLDVSAAAELIRDTIATALTAGSNITITPNDGSDTITIAATGGGGSGAPYGQRPRSGGYIVPLGSTSSGALTSTVRAAPVEISASCTADRIGIEITTLQSGSTVGLAIYAEDTATGLPGALVLDAGTIDSSGTGFKEITISQSLSAGRYWLGCRTASGTNPSARTTTATYALGYVSAQSDLANQFAGVVGGSSFASTFTTTPTIASVVGRTYLRIA